MITMCSAVYVAGTTTVILQKYTKVGSVKGTTNVITMCSAVYVAGTTTVILQKYTKVGSVKGTMQGVCESSNK